MDFEGCFENILRSNLILYKFLKNESKNSIYNNIDNEDVIEAASKLFDNQVLYLPITQILKKPNRIFDFKTVSTLKIVRSILIERS